MALFEARGLTISFGGHNAVNEVDLDVERGCVTGLIGPNGAGKTTIFNAITGLEAASRGTLNLDGRDITHETPRQRARLGIARTFQQLEVFGSLSTRDNVLVGGRDPAPLGARPSFEPAPATPRRSSIGSACARSPMSGPTRFRPDWPGSASWAAPSPRARRLLLLDEPASGLSDHETETFAELLRSLAAEGMAVLLVEHDVGLVMSLCASVHVIDYGALVSVGTPTEIRRNQAVLTRTWATDRQRTQSSAPTPVSAPRPREPASPEDEVDPLPVLELRSVTAAYGKIEVLHGIDLVLPRGKVVALLGPNGSGKSTTLRVASGQMRPSSGCVHLGGRHVNGVASDALACIGFCTIPEGRGVFPNLSVRENLVMASYVGLPLGQIEERTYAYFPRLEQRRFQLAGTLSGGEQRMLALARALATEPTVLLLDEMSMGLAPLIVEELYGLVDDIAKSGVSILAGRAVRPHRARCRRPSGRHGARQDRRRRSRLGHRIGAVVRLLGSEAMSKQEVPSPDGSLSASDRVEEFLAGVYALQIPSQTERRERRLFWSGVVIAIAGFAVIGMGWWGASGTKYVYQEIPYVISGGIFGASLVIVGAALFARYSVARLLALLARSPRCRPADPNRSRRRCHHGSRRIHQGTDRR